MNTLVYCLLLDTRARPALQACRILWPAYCGRAYCGRALAHRQAGGAHVRVGVEVAVKVDERGGAAGRAAHGHLVEADGRHIVQEAPLARARRAEIKDRQQRPALGSSSASYVSAYSTASC